MTRFTIDVGNSSIGVGSWSGDEVDVVRVAEPAEAARRVTGAAVAISVNHGRLRELLEALPEEFAECVRVLAEPPLPLADAELATTAGADRLAVALALVPGPGIAIDAGTAVTLDVVDGAGVYQGGFIAPGPAAAAAGLAGATAQLPRLDGYPAPLELGCNTRDAMAAGLWGMAVGGVDRLLAEARRFLDEHELRAGRRGAVRVVATGAWGPAWVHASTWEGVELQPALVHAGIRRWATRA